MAVYLLHYVRPYPNGRQPQHYIGYARNVKRRVQQHATGTSRARLPTVMYERGIPFIVARIWPDGDLALERRLHRWNKPAALCPTCGFSRRRGVQTLPLFAPEAERETLQEAA
jgi:hypothetical protein